MLKICCKRSETKSPTEHRQPEVKIGTGKRQAILVFVKSFKISKNGLRVYFQCNRDAPPYRVVPSSPWLQLPIHRTQPQNLAKLKRPKKNEPKLKVSWTPKPKTSSQSFYFSRRVFSSSLKMSQVIWRRGK